MLAVTLLAMLQFDFADQYRAALVEREQALGTNNPKVARSAVELGLYLRESKRPDQARPLFERALRIDEEVYGREHVVVAEDLEHLASVCEPREAGPLLLRAVEIRRKTGPPLQLAEALAKLGSIAPPDRAVPWLREALDIRGKEAAGSDVASSTLLNDLGLALREVDAAESEKCFRRALAIQEKLLGAKHPETGTTLNNLASLLLATDRVAEAEVVQKGALSILESTLGEDHARVAVAWSNLGDVLRAKGQLQAAEKCYRRALAIDERLYGAAHPEVLADVEKLAGLLDDRGARREAAALRERLQR